MEDTINDSCRYCKLSVNILSDAGINCNTCERNIHLRCLRKGAVPGGLNGDVFFTFACEDCSTTREEVFTREKMSW